MSFAPYQPAPDEPPPVPVGKGKQKSKPQRPWFPTQASSYVSPTAPSSSSYQSGAIPSFGAAASSQVIGSNGVAAGETTTANQWETRFGWRVDAIAAWTYLFGPITALVILILETQNDYVRFHAYQSALAISPLYFIHFILGVSRAPLWLRWIWFIAEYGVIFALSWRAYHDAHDGGLARYRLPWIGDLADAWVSEE